VGSRRRTYANPSNQLYKLKQEFPATWIFGAAISLRVDGF